MSRNTKIMLIVVAILAIALIAYGYQSRHDELIQQGAVDNG